ncbi:MAG: hypothetical protein GX552_18585 [Chloroflexi bacterium]|jgi:serine protease Do|nr:hypothetical protein [Chloroflexota bacterium]
MRHKGLRRLFIPVLLLLLLTGFSANGAGAVDTLGSGVGDLPEGQTIGEVLKAQATITPRFGQPPAQQAPGYDEYVALEDETGALYVEVPAEWSDVDTSLLTTSDGEVFAASIKASTDIDAFDTTYNVPGVQFIAFRTPRPDFTVDELLDGIDFTGCQYEGRMDYQDNLYTGSYDRYVGCNNGYANLTVLAAMPAEGDFVTLVVIQATSEADIEAGNRIANTFQVIGELPVPSLLDTPSG